MIVIQKKYKLINDRLLIMFQKNSKKESSLRTCISFEELEVNSSILFIPAAGKWKCRQPIARTTINKIYLNLLFCKAFLSLLSLFPGLQHIFLNVLLMVGCFFPFCSGSSITKDGFVVISAGVIIF